MPKIKKRWNAWCRFVVLGFGPVEFYGRKPFLVLDPKHREALMEQTGVFEELPGDRLRYIGNAEFSHADGTKSNVSPEGDIELDDAIMPASQLAAITKECDP